MTCYLGRACSPAPRHNHRTARRGLPYATHKAPHGQATQTPMPRTPCRVRGAQRCAPCHACQPLSCVAARHTSRYGAAAIPRARRWTRCPYTVSSHCVITLPTGCVTRRVVTHRAHAQPARLPSSFGRFVRRRGPKGRCRTCPNFSEIALIVSLPSLQHQSL